MGSIIWRLASLGIAGLMTIPGLQQKTLVAPSAPVSSTLNKPRAPWEAVGTLLEACSCSVPCSCNFGQGPSNVYCHTVYAYRLKSARFGGTRLDGLVFGGGDADKGSMGFLDSRATGEQRPALEKLAYAVFGKGGPAGGVRKFESVTVIATDDSKRFRVSFGDSGGFDADILFGRNRKRPITVDNNTTWPVERFVKGKVSQFEYHDAVGNRLQLRGVNANLGEFHLWGDSNTGKPESPKL